MFQSLCDDPTENTFSGILSQSVGKRYRLGLLLVADFIGHVVVQKSSVLASY